MKPKSYYGWYLERSGDVTGPFTAAQIRQLWLNGGATLNDRICQEGGEDWQTVRNRLDLLEGQEAPDGVAKLLRHGIYAGLGMWAGPLGAHNFFANQNMAGMAKLAGSIVGIAGAYYGHGWGWILIGLIWAWAIADAVVGPDGLEDGPERDQEVAPRFQEPEKPFVPEAGLGMKEWAAIAIAAAALAVMVYFLG